jgi:hypothetical protein
MIERAVINNAGPLVALSLLERLDVLPALFWEFWIPAPVYAEVMTAGLGRPRTRLMRLTPCAPGRGTVRPVHQTSAA